MNLNLRLRGKAPSAGSTTGLEYMMEPNTISEKLMFTTVRLVASDGSSGTGFFFNFEIDGMIVPTIITNKHVVKNNSSEIMTFHLHLRTDKSSSDESLKVTFNTFWHFHSKYDLCFCFVNPLFEQIRMQTQKEVFYTANDESIIASSEKLSEFSALEELVMVGYPIGIWDEKHNFPVFRRGYTASHPAIGFNGLGIGLADMACFPGSSGSPIYILNENGYSDKKGNTYLGRKRIILLGILFAGPQFNAAGEIVVQNIPTQQKVQSVTPVMVNLGYYVQSTELLEFKSIIKQVLVR